MTPAPSSHRSQLIAGLALIGILAVSILVFLPGQSGSFRFDDYGNLEPLQKLQDGSDTAGFWQFVVHGMTSPTGRPISLASFAMQAHDWPQGAAEFLRVNLLIHLLNGTLLLWLWLRVMRLFAPGSVGALAIPLAATLIWMVSPIQVTAVLYVVQRMTELAATFVFSGLLMYVIGREAFIRGMPWRGLLLCGLGLGWGAGVGTLAKENAALMPFMVLALEVSLFARLARPTLWRWLFGAMVVVPVVGLVGYLLVKTIPGHEAYAMREFTLLERLMTEPRVLFMYLRKILLPWPSAIRLWYDDYPTSTSLWQPWSTLPAMLLLLAAIVVAWRKRLQWPVLSFAVFWFLGSHVLESTVLPLELIFEHRNYQASAAIWLALALGIPALWGHLPNRRSRVVVAGFCAVFICIHALVTWRVSAQWGDPFANAMWEGQRQPDSRRAQIEMIGMLASFGLKPEAADASARAAEKWPDDPTFHLSRLRAACIDPTLPPVPMDEIRERVRRTPSRVLPTIFLIDAVLLELEKGQCEAADISKMREIIEAARANPRLMTQRQNMLLIHARILKLDGQHETARAVFREAVETKPQIILLVQGTLDEIEAGRIKEARQYLQQAENDPRISTADRLSHREDLDALARLIEMVESGLPVTGE